MKYKIVKSHSNLIITTIPTKEEGNQFIDDFVIASHVNDPNGITPDLIVIPVHYQWLYSYRNGKYMWMEQPYTIINSSK